MIHKPRSHPFLKTIKIQFSPPYKMYRRIQQSILYKAIPFLCTSENFAQYLCRRPAIGSRGGPRQGTFPYTLFPSGQCKQQYMPGKVEQ